MRTVEKSRIPRSGEAIVIPARVALRALESWEIGPGGCHLSTYSTGSHGYGQIGWRNGDDRHVTTAHRAAWTAVHGQIELGVTIDHVCRVRRCVNVDHLRELSNVENASDNGQVRTNPETSRRCHVGHRLARSGRRTYCRECSAARKRAAR